MKGLVFCFTNYKVHLAAFFDIYLRKDVFMIAVTVNVLKN
jgi:hypothetical protein